VTNMRPAARSRRHQREAPRAKRDAGRWLGTRRWKGARTVEQLANAELALDRKQQGSLFSFQNIRRTQGASRWARPHVMHVMHEVGGVSFRSAAQACCKWNRTQVVTEHSSASTAEGGSPGGYWVHTLAARHSSRHVLCTNF